MSADPDVTQGVVRELVNLSRRFRTNADRLHPELGFVDYSLLTQMAQPGGVRAGDLVHLTGLNKSTISRQLAALQRAGLVVRELHPQDNRVQLLRPSERGRQLLALANTRMEHEVSHRTHGWTSQEVDTFRTLLARYNAATSPAADPQENDRHRPGR
ncbi:MarR family transcriptional regulator [Streptomyces sp. RB6PN25]|uniref:MarR family transcriptional regulator n=1 Tax=Streptomyces humicola TaxID=2953240 RepID=A0ABT1PNI8_9ACTN|nr:MarR family transcriptional regulator [Streptomyces humicola]MCQ4079241.1 MarR family transcriptional regulator [Streptomyces humicola]